MTPSALLMARGGFNLLFGLVLLALPGDPSPGFGRGAFYATVDGTLALAFAFALRRSPARWLFPLLLADALLRLAAGTMIFVRPGMHETLFGSAVFLTLLVAALIALGLIGGLFVLVKRPAGGDAIVTPALILCLVTLMLGVGLAYGILSGGQRTALAWYAVAAGPLLAYAGHRAGRPA